MARPRIFVSSTFYDLRQVREDLERFIKELGYEPVLNEKGKIPYGKDEPVENYAYREVELSDILVSIIGGRYGSSDSSEEEYSISQQELKRALDRGIQVFIFIKQDVAAEFNTYKINRENDSINYNSVDDTRIFSFIDYLYKLPRNNPISTFETSMDIVKYLKGQWSGLFQRFLQEQKRLSEFKIVEEMKSVSNTLQELVKFLTEERRNKDEAIQNILHTNHPAFRRFAELTSTSYRVYFSNISELNRWLKARGFSTVSPEEFDDDSNYEWFNSDSKEYIKITKDIFDEDGRLKIFTEENWDDNWIKKGIPPNQDLELGDDFDDLPF